MPIGGAAIMRNGENLLYLARKEQCLALGTQLRTFKINNYKIYRIFPSGEVQCRCLVYTYIGRLRRQDDGNQQFERVSVLQFRGRRGHQLAKCAVDGCSFVLIHDVSAGLSSSSPRWPVQD